MLLFLNLKCAALLKLRKISKIFKYKKKYLNVYASMEGCGASRNR